MKSKKNKEKQIIYILIIIVGFFLVLFTILSDYIIENTNNYVETTGKFDEYEYYINNTGYKEYRERYIYEVDGTEYTVTSKHGSGTNPKVSGKPEKKVKYNPDKPSQAILVEDKEQIVFGIILIILGVFLLVKRRLLIKKEKREEETEEQEEKAKGKKENKKKDE